MSTHLHKLVLESGADSLHAKVWAGTPWIVEAWVGHLEGDNISRRERDMIEWCFESYGDEAWPFTNRPRPGKWKRGGATVHGWGWFGFSTEWEMQQFVKAWPTPPEHRSTPAGSEEEGVRE